MKNEIKNKTAFWGEVVARINKMAEQGITPIDTEETIEMFRWDMQEIESAYYSNGIYEEDNETAYDGFIEFMDGVRDIIIAA